MTPEEMKAAIAFNKKERESGAFTDLHVVQLVEYWQAGHGLEDDGWCGRSTQASLTADMAPIAAPAMPLDWTPWDGPMDTQPRNRKEVYQIFGNPGSGSPDKAWEVGNIIECHPNNKNQLPGVPGKWWVKIHRLVEPYLREALRRAQIACPDYRIERIAGYNFRHIRHSSKNPLSMHSWGIAVDVDPHKNAAREFKRGTGPVGWSPEYMKIWPNGLPKAFVDAFESCGFAWGSDWNEDGLLQDHTFYDPMHFEWVARDGKNHMV